MHSELPKRKTTWDFEREGTVELKFNLLSVQTSSKRLVFIAKPKCPFSSLFNNVFNLFVGMGSPAEGSLQLPKSLGL